MEIKQLIYSRQTVNQYVHGINLYVQHCSWHIILHSHVLFIS